MKMKHKGLRGGGTNRKRYHNGGVGNGLKVKRYYGPTGLAVNQRRLIKEEVDSLRKCIKYSDFSHYQLC